MMHFSTESKVKPRCSALNVLSSKRSAETQDSPLYYTMEDCDKEPLINDTNEHCNSFTVEQCSTNLKSSIKKIFSLNWLKMCGINLLPFGLELCACAGFTYIPPVMLKNGFTERTLTVVMGIGPFISLLLVPIIGRWSDKCTSRFGRRRPFMLILGIIMLISLVLIPFNNEIFINPNTVLAIGVILLDFSSQALMNPCKSLIPDVYHSLDEQSSAFTVYSCMLSLGGCVGYLVTSINWTSTNFGKCLFDSQEKVVFSLLATGFLLLLILNLYLAKETPIQMKTSLFNSFKGLDEGYDCFSLEKDKNSFFKCSTTTLNINGLGSHPILTEKVIECQETSMSTSRLSSPVQFMKIGFKKSVCVMLLPVHVIQSYIKSFSDIPPALFQLFIACLFGWMGIMCHDLYYSDFVGQVIYRGKPHDERESVGVSLYDEGVRMGSLGLLLQCLTAAVYAAFVQEHLINYYGRRKTYLFGMVTFTVSLLGTVLANSVVLVNALAAVSGIGLTAITTVPYSLVTEYYSAKDYISVAKERGVGEDMAVLDSAFYLSQIIPSLFLGYIVEWTGSSATYMAVAASCGAAATYFSLFVTFNA